MRKHISRRFTNHLFRFCFVCYVGVTSAAVVLLVSNTGRWKNSPSSDSHGHGRFVPTASDRRFWEQGIPNGTGGISSIFKDHLGTEAIQPSQGGGRRTTSLGQAVCSIGIRIVYTEENGDVNAQEEFIHARKLVPAGAVYLFLLPRYCDISSVCAANITQAPINF